MDKQDLSELFVGKIFNIPDYQRGYAWEEKQLKDFIEDIDALATDALATDDIQFHYTGTIVTFRQGEKREYNHKDMSVFDIVDGQQRLTSVILYLSVIIRALVEKGEPGYQQNAADFLYDDGADTYRLNPNNDTKELFAQLLKEGEATNVIDGVSTLHQKRLVKATEMFKEHIKTHEVDALKELFKAITSKLVFTYYTIKKESEIGMTFELMNARGKGLSILELLKNYFMHWIYRNGEMRINRG